MNVWNVVIYGLNNPGPLYNIHYVWIGGILQAIDFFKDWFPTEYF